MQAQVCRDPRSNKERRLRLHSPRARIDVKCRAIVSERSIWLSKPVDRITVVVPQQDVRAAVTIVVADAVDVPIVSGIEGGLIQVAAEGTIRLPEQAPNQPGVVPPENVVAAVAVDVASPNDASRDWG